MASSVDVWTLLIIVSLAHSLFTGVLLLLRKEHKRREGKWLLMLLLGLFWLQLEFLSIRWPFDFGVSIFYGTRHGSWLLIGPVFFFYIKSLLGWEVQRSAYIYLLPFLLFTIVLPLLLNDFLSFRQVHYGMLTPFDQRPDTISFWQYVYAGVFIFQFFYLAFFVMQSRKSIASYKLSLQQYYAQLEDRKIRWLKMLWLGMLLIVVMASLFLVILFFTEIYRRHMDYLYVIPTSILIYAISYQLFSTTFESPIVNPKYQKSGLKSREAEAYKNRLQQLIKEEKLFLKNGLKLNELAELLKIPNYQLSEVLNQHMHTTFFDLINGYRIEEAKKQIKANPQFTLLQIAHDSGFNNKTSFVNSFKRFEGITPSQYLKKLR